MVKPKIKAAMNCTFSCHKTMIAPVKVVCDVMPLGTSSRIGQAWAIRKRSGPPAPSARYIIAVRLCCRASIHIAGSMRLRRDR
jgi:hypothetical protein